MPTYVFKNTDTEEVFEKIMSYDEKVEFLNNNPNVTSIIATAGIIGGISMDSGRLPEGFKDKLRLIKQKHPRANGVNHLI